MAIGRTCPVSSVQSPVLGTGSWELGVGVYLLVGLEWSFGVVQEVPVLLGPRFHVGAGHGGPARRRVCGVHARVGQGRPALRRSCGVGA